MAVFAVAGLFDTMYSNLAGFTVALITMYIKVREIGLTVTWLLNLSFLHMHVDANVS